MTTPTEAPVLLDVRGLRVAFGGHEVVHGIDFQIRAGEKLALVGESGSGKSISALSLLRLAGEARVSGEVRWNAADPSGAPASRDLLSLSDREIRRVRGDEIAMIFQEPMTALNPLYPVGDQIAEVLQVKRGLTRREAWQAAIARLAETGIPEPERRAQAYPHQLSGGQRQRAMIAMALACEPRLLLADEPTTALDVTLRVQILDLLAELQRKTGLAVLLITHDLPLVRRFADRVAVMEKGHIVEQGRASDVLTVPQHAYTRRLVDSRPARQVPEASADAPELLRGQAVRVSYPIKRPGLVGLWRAGEFVAVQGADFLLRRGHTLALMGESGSGKSTLALATLGLMRHQGEITFKGQPWTGQRGAALRTLRRLVQVVFQDPFSSLSPRMTVEELVGEGLRVHEPRLTAAERRERVLEVLAEVGLDEIAFPHLLSRYPHEFSGGQRQRLAIARALVVRPEVLVLDEPTSALDVSIQKQVLSLLQRLQTSRGLSYLLITHDVDVVRAMAHDVIVMKSGEVVEAGEAMQVLEHPHHDYTRRLVAAAA